MQITNFQIRQKLEMIKEKQHGEDVDWLIQVVEMLLNEKTPTQDPFREDFFNDSASSSQKQKSPKQN